MGFRLSSLSAPSWQYRDRKKSEASTMPYSQDCILSKPSIIKTCNQFWMNDGPPSTTLEQHYFNMVYISLVSEQLRCSEDGGVSYWDMAHSLWQTSWCDHSHRYHALQSQKAVTAYLKVSSYCLLALHASRRIRPASYTRSTDRHGSTGVDSLNEGIGARPSLVRRWLYPGRYTECGASSCCSRGDHAGLFIYLNEAARGARVLWVRWRRLVEEWDTRCSVRRPGAQHTAQPHSHCHPSPHRPTPLPHVQPPAQIPGADWPLRVTSRQHGSLFNSSAFLVWPQIIRAGYMYLDSHWVMMYD